VREAIQILAEPPLNFARKRTVLHERADEDGAAPKHFIDLADSRFRTLCVDDRRSAAQGNARARACPHGTLDEDKPLDGRCSR